MKINRQPNNVTWEMPPYELQRLVKQAIKEKTGEVMGIEIMLSEGVASLFTESLTEDECAILDEMYEIDQSDYEDSIANILCQAYGLEASELLIYTLTDDAELIVVEMSYNSYQKMVS